jgi:hypothetical protein
VDDCHLLPSKLWINTTGALPGLHNPLRFLTKHHVSAAEHDLLYRSCFGLAVILIGIKDKAGFSLIKKSLSLLKRKIVRSYM